MVAFGTALSGGLSLRARNVFDRAHVDPDSDARLPSDNLDFFAGRGRRARLGYAFPNWTGGPGGGYPTLMPVIATIMNSTTGQPIQKMTFGRMPKPWASFNLETGELVTADRVDVGKPAPGKVIVPVSVWVTPKK